LERSAKRKLGFSEGVPPNPPSYGWRASLLIYYRSAQMAPRVSVLRARSQTSQAVLSGRRILRPW